MSSRVNWLLVLALLLGSFPGGPRAWSDPMPNVPDLAHKLQRALISLPGYSVFDYVSFRITDDRIVLVGNVLHPQLKEQAEQAVRSVTGVKTVENDIEILPQSQQDNAIRDKVYQSLYQDPQFTSYAVQLVSPVHIIVKSGQVTLEGVVNKSSDRFVAENAVAEVVGSSVVNDHLLAMSSDAGDFSTMSSRLQ